MDILIDDKEEEITRGMSDCNYLNLIDDPENLPESLVNLKYAKICYRMSQGRHKRSRQIFALQNLNATDKEETALCISLPSTGTHV